MIKEIGSEYWLEEPNIQANTNIAVEYFFLGRMALKAIIIELKKQGLRTVLFPSYCCNSMLSPFLEESIEVFFYDVNYDTNEVIFDINLINDYDILFATNYFGYKKSDMNDFIGLFLRNNKVVIEDNTHSMFIKNDYSADYVFGSIRKWMPTIAGGAIFKSKNVMESDKGSPDIEYCMIKKKAMALKANYIKKGIGNKENFLSLYNQFNDYVDTENRILNIDDYSRRVFENLNVEVMINLRKRNASFLHKQLKKMEVDTLFELSEEDCPLFVPIMLRNKAERDNLRNRMIQNSIYCPVHWKKPKNCQSNIYDLELSLICDQRYDINDMKRIIKVIEGEIN